MRSVHEAKKQILFRKSGKTLHFFQHSQADYKWYKYKCLDLLKQHLAST